VRVAAVLVVHVTRLAVRRIGVRLIVVVRMVMMLVRVMMMHVIVVVRVMMMRSGRRRSYAFRRTQERPFTQQRTAFRVKQPRSHQRDQEIARDLDPPDGVAHGLGSCAKRSEERRVGKE